jgi:hypothetical protein
MISPTPKCVRFASPFRLPAVRIPGVERGTPLESVKASPNGGGSAEVASLVFAFS